MRVVICRRKKRVGVLGVLLAWRRKLKGMGLELMRGVVR